jgi:Trk K+ transport system NAD-binding subunit
LRGVKNKKYGECFEIRDLKKPPDSERRETFEALIPFKLLLKRVLVFFQDKLIIGAVFRDQSWEVAVGDTHIQAGESVIVICISKHLKDVRKLFIG